jgi:hypothetical protein
MDMLSTKKNFQRQAHEAQMPACTLFPDSIKAKDGDFIEVTGLAMPSTFKPSLSTLTFSDKTLESDKNATCLI